MAGQSDGGGGKFVCFTYDEKQPLGRRLHIHTMWCHAMNKRRSKVYIKYTPYVYGMKHDANHKQPHFGHERQTIPLFNFTLYTVTYGVVLQKWIWTFTSTTIIGSNQHYL